MQVGVGAMVVNKHDEVLAIRERSGVTAKLKNFWKLPGRHFRHSDPFSSITQTLASR